MTSSALSSSSSVKWMAYTFISIASILCLVPFLLVLSGSLTANDSIVGDGYNLIPGEWSLEGYRTIFNNPDKVLRAYAVTGITTVTGTLLGMFLITMSGYVLQRKDFRYRNAVSFFIYFTTLFGGGLVPWYILVTKYLRLTDSLWALILPGLLSPFLIILMRSFMSSMIPDEVIESAKIDGAGDFLIYWRITLPISLPGLATIGLFLTLHYWNDWYLSSLFINNPEKYQLQYYLYNVINNAKAIQDLAISGVTLNVNLPMETTKMAMSIIAVGPILFLYPFVQRYFVKGLTIGAVKG